MSAPLAGYLLVFVAVGAIFVLANLVVGLLVRPNHPDAEKKTTYECGETTIGSAWIQFDLRFYVVALLFVIFDVEVAFFFPWAEVFGKNNALAAAVVPDTTEGLAAMPWREKTKFADLVNQLNPDYPEHKAIRQKFAYNNLEKLTVKDFQDQKTKSSWTSWLAFSEILVFFGFLLVGFAYLWKRGDLEWVRSTEAATPEERAKRIEVEVSAPVPEQELVGAHH